MTSLTINGFLPMFTVGFRSLTSDVQAEIMYVAFKRISDKTDMIVFLPENSSTQEHLEDQDRTLVTKAKGLTAKVYAKLDDFGSSESLAESMGVHYPTNSKVQRVLTFMLAEEY